jgi:hypothetical protein
MFFKPNLENLEKQQDIPGLVKVVCGKDNNLSKEAAPILGKLLLKKCRRDEGGLQAVIELGHYGGEDAIAALLYCLTAERNGWFKLKSDAALALYELGQIKALFDALEKMERREALHVSLSRDLLDRAIAHRDYDFVEYLLVNGSWDYPSDVRPGWEFLASAGRADAIARLLEDQHLWFMYEGKRSYTVSGAQGRIVYDAVQSNQE